MPKEFEPKKNSDINKIQQILRLPTAAIFGSTLFRTETIDVNNSIKEAEEVLKRGEGLILVINHFSRGEPNRAIDLALSNPTMNRRRIVAPIAAHMDNPLYHFIGRINAANLMPIITKNTKKKEKFKDRKLNEGKMEYLEESIDALKNGNVVIIAPQGERMATLGEPDDPAIGTLMAQAHKKGLDNYSFLFIGYGIDGAQDYSRKRGFNIRDKYTARIGACLSAKEILSRANGKYRNVDFVIYDELAKVVPQEYISPKILNSWSQ